MVYTDYFIVNWKTYSSKIYSTTVYFVFLIRLHGQLDLEFDRFVIMSSVLIYFGIEYHNMMYVALTRIDTNQSHLRMSIHFN